MPFTPLHFGPALAFHAADPRHISFLAFCATNVVIDLEALYNLGFGRHPVHAFLHTYVGATIVAFTVILGFAALRKMAQHLPNIFAWKDLNLAQVITGAALGVYSHVILDSIMHSDIQPFAPWTSSNHLYRFVSISALHWFCLATGALGLIILGIRMRLHSSQRTGVPPQTKTGFGDNF